MHGVRQPHGGFRRYDYEREEANAEAARATAIRKHVRVKAARDPTGHRRPPGAGRGRIQAVAGARRRRAWSTCSNSARPTSGRTVSGGRGPVRPRPRWSERTAASPATEKGTYALCWLTGSLWPRRPRLSRLRPARAQPPGGEDRPTDRPADACRGKWPVCRWGPRGLWPCTATQACTLRRPARRPRTVRVAIKVPAAYLPAGPRLARRGLLAQFIADTATLN